MEFYHYIPKDQVENVKKIGIISPYYAKEVLNDKELAKLMLEKYRDRAKKWGKYKKSSKKLTIEEIRKELIKFREHKKGDAYIYALRHKIPEGFDDRLDRFLSSHVQVKFDTEDLDKASYYWGKKNKKYYEKVHPDEYWKDRPGELLFGNVPHPAIMTREGRIPPDIIKIGKVTNGILYSLINA